MAFRICSPAGYGFSEVDAERLAMAGVTIESHDRPEDAVAGADAVYTDTWTSMGQEAEAEQRRRDFEGFQVDERLMGLASSAAIFLHRLPAHRIATKRSPMPSLMVTGRGFGFRRPTACTLLEAHSRGFAQENDG